MERGAVAERPGTRDPELGCRNWRPRDSDLQRSLGPRHLHRSNRKAVGRLDRRSPTYPSIGTRNVAGTNAKTDTGSSSGPNGDTSTNSGAKTDSGSSSGANGDTGSSSGCNGNAGTSSDANNETDTVRRCDPRTYGSTPGWDASACGRLPRWKDRWDSFRNHGCLGHCIYVPVEDQASRPS